MSRRTVTPFLKGEKVDVATSAGLLCRWKPFEKINVFQTSIASRSLFGKDKSRLNFYNKQYNIILPEHQREQYNIFPPTFTNINLRNWGLGPLMYKYSVKQLLMSQPQRIVSSSFEVASGTFATALLLF